MKNIIGTEIGQNSNNKRYYNAEFAEKMGLPVKVILAFYICFPLLSPISLFIA